MRYPFGFGLSYTTFEMGCGDFALEGEKVRLKVRVRNTGSCPGKEVAQVYVSAPQGKLGKPGKVLAAFAKTRELAPGEEEEISFAIPFEAFASYDETGAAGAASVYVLEQGTYVVYVGNSLNSLKEGGRFTLWETSLVRQCSQALAPVKPFRRMKPSLREEGGLAFLYEETPVRGESPAEKRDRKSVV